MKKTNKLRESFNQIVSWFAWDPAAPITTSRFMNHLSFRCQQHTCTFLLVPRSTRGHEGALHPPITLRHVIWPHPSNQHVFMSLIVFQHSFILVPLTSWPFTHSSSCPCGSHSECVSPQHHTMSLCVLVVGLWKCWCTSSRAWGKTEKLSTAFCLARCQHPF